MVRFSDILKKKKTLPQAEQGQPNRLERPAPEMPAQPGFPRPRPEELRIAEAIQELKLNAERSQKLYLQGLQLVKDLFIHCQEDQQIELKPVKELVQEIVDCLVLGNKKTFMSLFHEDYTVQAYPYNHIINVMLLSIILGMELGYNKSQLNVLGLASFLHDIGMAKLKEIVCKPDRLSKEEFDQVRAHATEGAKIIAGIKDISKEIIYAVKEHHRRFDKSGYPNEKMVKEISAYASIISVVDVYEALSHTRSFRKKYSSYQALNEMLTIGGSPFDPAILKILINQVGIYPIGSWVELNTKELAKVSAANTNFPLRPVVNIMFDASRNRLKQPHTVDLYEQTNLHIKRPLTDEEILNSIKNG